MCFIRPRGLRCRAVKTIPLKNEPLSKFNKKTKPTDVEYDNWDVEVTPVEKWLSTMFPTLKIAPSPCFQQRSLFHATLALKWLPASQRLDHRKPWIVTTNPLPSVSPISIIHRQMCSLRYSITSRSKVIKLQKPNFFLNNRKIINYCISFIVKLIAYSWRLTKFPEKIPTFRQNIKFR